MAQILVIEDEIHALNLVCSILERKGYSTHATTTGQDGILYCQSHPELKAVILDFNLNDICGTAVIQAIRSKNLQLPIVITTGYGDDPDVQACLKIPNVCLLHKPYEIKVLLKLVHDLISLEF